jgi:hypothetical protein
VGQPSSGYWIDASAIGGVGVARAGVGEVDILDLGRRAATVVEQTPRRGGLADLYDSALNRRRQS